MPAQKTCAQCAAPLPANAPLGLCPACLINTGLRAFSFAAEPGERSEKKEKSKTHTTVGDYELLEEVARGGMGIVFRARQISLDRVVAVKALLFGEFASDPFVARFRAEAQAAGALQHPNIVAIHDVWEHRGQHFFSMEFVQGQTLAQIIKEGPLASKRAAGYAATIARAVHFAHTRNIVHRDLKPSNVLIDQNDVPRITDFGLAKRIDQDAAQTTSGVVGSPHYMSPEQAGRPGAEVGPAADIYSIGAMLYHMLTGRPPFAGETTAEILSQTLNSEPVSPRLLNASVPRDLETICLKCLQKEPRRRYASAEDLAADLDRFLQDLPIRARAITPFERTIRWCRRNPTPTALLVLLAVVAIVSTWASFHLEHLNETIRVGQYLSDMTVAMRHIEDGDNAHALALLKSHIPKNKFADLRGFEWRYMWSQCRGNFANWLPTHRQVVGAIHFTSDGKKILTYSWDNSARLWDARARRNLLTLQNVLSIGGFTPDEQAIVVCRTNGVLQIIDANTGATNRSIPNIGELLAYSASTQIAATLDENNSIQVWNVANTQHFLAISNAPQSKLEYSWNSPVIISPDGSKLAMLVASPVPKVRIWDIPSGKELNPLPENNRQLRCAVFSPDSQSLLTGGGAGEVYVWNLSTATFKKVTAHQVPVLAIAFSPDGKTFATASSDRDPIILWDFETRAKKENQFLGQAGDVFSLCFSRDGKQLASGARDTLVRIWNIEQASILPKLERLHADRYANIAFSPNSRFFAGGCKGNTVKIWDVASLQVVATIPRASYVVAFSTDNQRILVSGEEWNAFWWDIEKRTAELLPTYGGKQSGMSCVAISPDRRYAALGMDSGAILIVDMTTGLVSGPNFKGHAGPVRSLAFSPDGEKLASGGSDKNVMLWNVRTGASLGACAEHKGAVFGVTISPDGKTLASGCGAETIKLWNADHIGKRAWASASYHRSVIRSLSFSPDNRTLASGSEDRTVKLWNFAAFARSRSRNEVASFLFDSPLRSVLFSPDGNTLAAVTDRGELRLFHALSLEECDRQAAELR